MQDNSTLENVLEKSGLKTKKGIAVALNNAVIPKTSWAKYILNAKDKITVITATQVVNITV
jgi:sulfur carrier protein